MVAARRIVTAGLLILGGCSGPPPPARVPTTSTEIATEEAPEAAPEATSSAPVVVEKEGPPSDAVAPSDAESTASGLKFKVLARGSGSVHAADTDRVLVNYTGWNNEGTEIDSSDEKSEPANLPVEGVIAGFGEVLKLMVEGEKRRVWIPANLAYGNSPWSQSVAGDLVFDIELLEIIRPPEPPVDVSSPPATATTTRSGLSYVFLTRGSGTRRPTMTDKVTVNYSGWTTDGKLFDSTVTRGRAMTFEPRHLIAGFAEALMLMVEGDKARFWIPANLAYGNSPRPGAPSGTLVYEIELLKVE